MKRKFVKFAESEHQIQSAKLYFYNCAKYCDYIQAWIAQLVVHWLGTWEVRGLNPGKAKILCSSPLKWLHRVKFEWRLRRDFLFYSVDALIYGGCYQLFIIKEQEYLKYGTLSLYV